MTPTDTARDAPRACFIAAGLEVLGERWALLALREMSLGVHRFDQIARNTGASRDILTGRLRTLESHGVIERVQYSERPPRYEYHLTTSGAEVAPILISLAAWSSTWMRDETPRASYRHSCGADLQPDRVAELLLVYPEFPYSVRYSVERMYVSLKAITAQSAGRPRGVCRCQNVFPRVEGPGLSG